MAVVNLQADIESWVIGYISGSLLFIVACIDLP